MLNAQLIYFSPASTGLVLLFGFSIIAALVVRHRRLERLSRLIKTVAEQSNDGLLLQRLDGTIVWCNETFCETFGRPQSFWIGKKPYKWVVPPELRASDEDIENFRYDVTSREFSEFRIHANVHADGSRFWNQLSLTSVDIGERDPIVVLSCRDVTEQVKREKALTGAKDRLELAVNYDSLTGLANRRKLMNFLTDSLVEAEKKGAHVGMIAVDLDKFKETNDTHGHAAGDAVLMDAARILGESVCDMCLASRTGGDEFILVMPNVTSAETLHGIAKHILSDVSNPVLWEGKQLNYGASVGLAMSYEGQMDGEELIQRADFALYDAKARGRGTYSIYDEALKSEHLSQKGLAEDLANVIRKGGLDFYFQPIIDLKSMSICGIEALARWNHPSRGILKPVEFLTIAEDIGLLEDVDMAAMNAALDAYSAVREMGLDDVYVSFNVSFQTLSKPDLVDALKWKAAAADIPAGGIAVEVLETVLLGGGAIESDVAKHIEELENAGFHTRLDDFGTGYAGLKHLAQLKAKGIKIDHSLVRSILADETSDIVVRAILRLARSLDMDVVAEGVEDVRVAEKLREYGCAAIQGFVVARPMPFDALKGWMLEFETHPVLKTVETRAMG